MRMLIDNAFGYDEQIKVVNVAFANRIDLLF